MNLLQSACKKCCKIINDRRRKDNTVKSVKNSAMSRNQFSIIFNVMITFDRRSCKITNL